MKCPTCGKEMASGRGVFLSMQGMGQMLLVFTPEAETGKGFLKKKTKERMIFPAEEPEAFYCADCEVLLPVLKC